MKEFQLNAVVSLERPFFIAMVNVVHPKLIVPEDSDIGGEAASEGAKWEAECRKDAANRCDDFVAKPINQEDLFAAVARWLPNQQGSL